MVIVRFYRWPGLSAGAVKSKLHVLKKASPLVDGLDTELCFNIEVSADLDETDFLKLQWILGSAFQPENLSQETRLQSSRHGGLLVEIGPRLSFSTAFSSNAVSICTAVGLSKVKRLELSTRYLIKWQQAGLTVSPATEDRLVGLLHDRMTQCRYVKPLESFSVGHDPQPWWEVDVLNEGKPALSKLNSQLGLAFDEWDLDYYTDLFRDKLGRNPTNVECFDLAQSNSEHSRHWFFKGRMVINGTEKAESLIDMIIRTQDTSNPNNVIKFSDNSSAIEGYTIPFFRPSDPTEASPFKVTDSHSHIIFTAETHNFPTGVAPFSGATTGTGGRIRDIQAVGRGGNYIAGTAGYCVGNLLIPGYALPWEDSNAVYPPNLASPLQILVEASNGASDYGNKFGEPLISGFVRSVGVSEASGERREWVKPIMFSGGVGSMQADWVDKLRPERGMRVVKLGGPVYRIGVGGGSASSVEVQGDNASELDYGAVQRGDAEMEQKLNRVIRACVEMPDNPVLSIHDQGAGGNGNVLKELVEPAGAVVFARAFELGDPTIDTMELWGAEYQESNAMLCRAGDVPLLEKIGAREQCPVSVVGVVTGSGRMVLSEEPPDFTKCLSGHEEEGKRNPVDLELELVLGKMPQKVYTLDRKPVIVRSLSLPNSVNVMSALERVLRLPAVASKRYLTNKVDRCVTGLIAQQQCVGPLHSPLADVAVTALSLFGTEGVATAIGEQPIKGLLDPAAGARMAVAESLTNLVFARISCLRDVKCSGNWMWPAKLPGEGAALYEACTAMCDSMRQLGIAIDGGKDSLSMAARVGQDTVKAPGSLVISVYAPCPDIRQVVTPDLKGPSLGQASVLLLVDLSQDKCRLGGSALGQCFRQLGDAPPDLEDAALLTRAFGVTQGLIADDLVSAGHDVSDGGLVVCLLEMSFAGVSGFQVDIQHKKGMALEILFSEELGWVLEVSQEHSTSVMNRFKEQQVPCWMLGTSKGYGMSSVVQISVGGEEVLRSQVSTLFRLWEETSFHLELLQTDPGCARSEFEGLPRRKPTEYHLTFDPEEVVSVPTGLPQPPCVAVIREEGTNGDREMAAALFRAGFQVWDVTMQDLIAGQVTTDSFRGVVFPGGFSYADVLGSAKGWAASLTFHDKLQQQFRTFVQREDTFSLGVCNGCQLMGLIGWIGVQSPGQSNSLPDIVLDQNLSQRFECRWSSVRIEKTPSVMLKGMEGSVLGVWVAHGEGRFTFRDNSVLRSLEENNCCAIRYVDDDQKPTEVYPFNPNGSQGGLAGICSKDGRHLAMMPHPERCTLMWQWPWKPSEWRLRDQSPWQRMFHNAYVWCSQQ